MKRIGALFLFIVMLMLCGCVTKKNQNDQTQLSQEQTETTNAQTEETTKDTPTEDLIMADLKGELQNKNKYAALSGMETVKSLANDGSYEITLIVNAKTKYAEWTYEVELSYTKYDQGWMMDDAKWNDGEYVLTGVPESEDVALYINDKVPSDYSNTTKKILPVDDGTIDQIDLLTGETFRFCWVKTIKCKHGEYAMNAQAYLYFIAEEDEWAIIETSEDGINGYAIYCTNTPLVCTADFSGTWTYNGTDLTISNFTGYSFDVQWGSQSSHFESTTVYSPAANCLYFKDSDGRLFSFSFSKDGTGLTLMSNTNHMIFYYVINDELAQLQ